MARSPAHAEAFARIAGRTRWHSLRDNEGLVALAFMVPALLAMVLFRLLPAAQAGWESVRNRGEFVGLDNYRFLWSSDAFRNCLKTTLIFGAVVNPAQIVLALVLALLFVQRLPGGRLARTLVFLPVAVPLLVSAVVWGIAFRPDDGLLNALLATVGLPAQRWLTSPGQALPSIMILASWVGVGYWMTFLIAGLQDIPSEYAEAAAVDGAGWWRTLVQITLPLLRRPLAFVLVADTVANFLLFAPVQVLTRGGPAEATNLIMFEVYRQAYTYGDLGLASAEVVIVVLVLLVVVSLQFRLLRGDGDAHGGS